MSHMELSLSQAAQRAHVTPTAIIALIRSQILPAEWTVRGWLMRADDLDRLVDQASRASGVTA